MGAWRVSSVMAGAALALAFAVPIDAQTPTHNAKSGNGHKSKPPSSSPLPGTTASPLSWVDDASLLAPGTMSLSVSAMRWTGADLSEVDFPIVDASVGLTKRVQLSASIPRIVGSADTGGPVGGVGTSYISGKIALLTGQSDVKLAVSPIVEVLGKGAAEALAPGESRLQLGLPISLEIAQGPARMFAATGFFSRGAWFAGGGAGVQATPRVGLSMSFTRSWAKTDTAGVTRDRRELSGGISYFATPQFGLYGSVGHTIATTDDNGAGMSVSVGVTFLLTPRITQ
jgi:hypothetical protein